MTLPDKIVIDLPALPSLGAMPSAFADMDAIRESLIFGLYGSNRMSLKEARTLLGISRREFEERLPTFGISMMSGTYFEEEIAAVEALSRKYS